MRDPASPKIGLALGGGAALGWAHIGVIRALDEAGVDVDIIAGTSIGAIIGAALAAGKVDEIEEIARSVNVGTILKFLDPSLKRGAILGGRKIRKILDAHFGGLRMENLARPFAVTASDLKTGEGVVISEGPVTDALMASIAVPVLFKPVEMNGHLLADGGLFEPVPARTVRQIGAERVIAVDLMSDYTSRVKRLRKSDRLPVAANLSIARASAYFLLKSYSQASLALSPPDVIIAPKIGHIDSANFARADQLIAEGRRVTEAAIDQILELQN